MATFQDLAATIREKIPSMTKFKIGKTGQELDERYRQEHEVNYKNIVSLGNSTSKEVINNCEEYLTKEFINNSKCDNKQIGGGDMGSSSIYIIHLAWN